MVSGLLLIRCDFACKENTNSLISGNVAYPHRWLQYTGLRGGLGMGIVCCAAVGKYKK